MYHRQQNKCYPKGVYLPISKVLSILAVANLLAHNNISQICYCSQIPLQSAAVNCSFSDNLTPFWVIFILLAMVHESIAIFCFNNKFLVVFYKPDGTFSRKKIRCINLLRSKQTNWRN